MQQRFLFFSNVLSIFLTRTITYRFRTSVLYSTFLQNIFCHSANSFPLTSVLPSLQLLFQHSFFHNIFTLFSPILLPSFQIIFHTSIIPFFLLVIHSSLPFPWPPIKFDLHFLFSSRKFNSLSYVRFYRKSFISKKNSGSNQYLYILILYITVLFSSLNKVMVLRCDNF